MNVRPPAYLGLLRAGRRSARARAPRAFRLPVKLVAAAMTLVGAAAVVVAVAGVTLLRGYLGVQADQQLRSYAEGLVRGSFVSGPVFSEPSQNRLGLDGLSVEILDPGGSRLVRAGGPEGQGGVPVTSAWITSHVGRLATVPGPGGHGSWRVIVAAIRYTAHRVPYVYGVQNVSVVVSARTLPGLPGLVVVGMDLAGIGQAARRLVVTDLLVTVVMLVLLAALGARLLRAALRPLTVIAETAVAAAAGQTARRVPGYGPGGLGVLARSVNEALDRAGELSGSGPTARAEAAAHRSRERMTQALADAVAVTRRSLSVIHGFTDYYRAGRRAPAASLDRMMGRVADEADRMAAAADALSRAAQRPDGGRPDGGRQDGDGAAAADGAGGEGLGEVGLTVGTGVGDTVPGAVDGDGAGAGERVPGAGL